MLRNLTLLGLVCLTLTASSLSAAGFDAVGVKLGLNRSTFVGNDIPQQGINPVPGLAIGGFAVYRLRDLHLAGLPAAVALQQEINFTTMGSRINSVGELQLTNIFMYLEVPLMAQVTFLPDERLQPFFFLGPTIMSRLLTFNEVGMLEDIRDRECDLTFGGGVRFGKVMLDLRVQHGLLSFDLSDDELDLKNHCFSLRMGFAF
jgi:hypothetical protein